MVILKAGTCAAVDLCCFNMKRSPLFFRMTSTPCQLKWEPSKRSCNHPFSCESKPKALIKTSANHTNEENLNKELAQFLSDIDIL